MTPDSSRVSAERATPQKVAKQFFAALNERRWDDAIALCDPGSLGRFRDHELASLIAWAENREDMARVPGQLFGFSTEDVLSGDRLAKQATVSLRAAPGMPTIGYLAALSPAGFAAFCLKQADSADPPNGDDVTERARGSVIGVVTEGESVAHVLFRFVGGGWNYDDPYYVELMRLCKGAAGWLIEADVNRHSIMLRMPLAFLFGDRPDVAPTQLSDQGSKPQ
jgi:hypothetical protein